MEKEPIKLVLDTDEVLDAFKLKRNLGCKTLDIWLNYQTKIDQNQEIILEKKRKRLEIEGYFWNEEELKMHFLSHIFDIIYNFCTFVIATNLKDNCLSTLAMVEDLDNRTATLYDYQGLRPLPTYKRQ